MFLCEYPHSQIHVYKNAFEDIGTLVPRIEALETKDNNIFTKWETWYPSGAEGKDDIAFGYQKKSYNHVDKKDNSEENIIYWSILDAIVLASKDYANKHNLEIGMLAPLSISKYKSGASMGKHTDSDGYDGPQTISVVCYLNDDYEGGEIRFEDQNIIIKPEAGSIIIFPSKPPFFHQSMVIKSGWKYISPGFWNIL